MNIKELKEKLLEVDLLSSYPFINGYGITTKTNKETGNDELVVEFKVSHKINKDELKEEYFLPKSLSSYGIDIGTKVSKELKSSVDCVNSDEEIIDYYNLVTELSVNSIESQNLYSSYLNYKTSFALISGNDYEKQSAFSFYPGSPYLDPIKYNYEKARPLSGGCDSIYYIGGGGGTLGVLVRDKQDRSIVALSNSHVYSRSLLIGEEAKKFGRYVNNTLSLSTRQPGDSSLNPYGDENPIVDHIGTPKRSSYISFVNSRNTYVDAAIVELSSHNLIDSSSNSVLWFKEKGPYSFASEEELYSLIDPSSINYQSPVFRSGRTLGPLGYPGNVNEDTIDIALNTYLTPFNMTPYLSTSDGVNIFTSGLCALKYECNSFLFSNQAYILFQSLDREKVYIIGNRYYFDKGKPTSTSSNYNIFNGLTGRNDDVELCIEDSNKIKIFGITRNNLSTYYVDDNNIIYVGGVRPVYLSIQQNRDPYFGERKKDLYFVTSFTEIDHNNSEIINGGVKKIYFDGNRAYILTEDNKLFVRGRNIEATDYESDNATALGYGSSGQEFLRFTKIPGEWLDYTTLDERPNSNFLLAISGDNRLYAAFTHQYNTNNLEGGASYYSDFLRDDYTNVDYVNGPFLNESSTLSHTFCASFDLTSNRIPIIIDGEEVFVKEFVTKDKTYGGCELIAPPVHNFLNLVTTDNKLIALSGKFYSGDDNNASYVKYNNEPIIWNDKCKKLGSSNNSVRNSAYISGGDIFISGENMNYDGLSYADDVKSFAKNTTFPLSSVYDEWPEDTKFIGTSVFKYEGFPNFNIASGVFSWWASLTNNNQSSLVYSDNFGVSGIGRNDSSTLINGLPDIRDEIIVTDVNQRIRVNMGSRSNPQYIIFNDVFSIQSKDKAFPVTDSGDSGTAVFALLSSTVPTASAWKFIGLVFAGPKPERDAKGKCINVQRIVNELDIEPWEGNIEE